MNGSPLGCYLHLYPVLHVSDHWFPAFKKVWKNLLKLTKADLKDDTVPASMSRSVSMCSDIKLYPDVTLMTFLSMPLSAFLFKFVQIKGHTLFQGETITMLKSYVAHRPLVWFFCFAFLLSFLY